MVKTTFEKENTPNYQQQIFSPTSYQQKSSNFHWYIHDRVVIKKTNE